MKILVFWLKNCKHCDKLKKELKKLPKDFEQPILIEHEHMSNLQRKKYNIKIFPTIVFLSNNNKILNTVSGYQNINDIIKEYNGVKLLENILNRNYKTLQ